MQTTDEAIGSAIAHASPEWRKVALEAVRICARIRFEFTTDDVWGVIAQAAVTHEPRALGAIMRQAAAFGWIEPTDRWVKTTRPAAHDRPVKVWRSLL